MDNPRRMLELIRIHLVRSRVDCCWRGSGGSRDGIPRPRLTMRQDEPSIAMKRGMGKRLYYTEFEHM